MTRYIGDQTNFNKAIADLPGHVHRMHNDTLRLLAEAKASGDQAAIKKMEKLSAKSKKLIDDYNL